MYTKKYNILFFAQQIHYPWIEGVKNNSIKITEILNEKIKVNIISHKSKNNNKDFDNINGVDVFYLLKLSDNKISQGMYLFLGGFKSLFFALKTKPKKIFVQYLDTSYIFPLILIKLLNPKLKIILTIYSTDEVSIGYKKRFLKYFRFEKIIIISEYLRSYVKNFGYKNKDIINIPLSYDEKRYLKYNYFQKRDKKTLLFSAGPIKEAGSFFMVDLAKIMPDYNFIFAMRKFNQKSEDELFLLKNYIKKQGVKNIEIKRNIEKMEDLLGEVGALILPLQDINVKMLIPVALLEAMARGTICFISDLPNLKYLIKYDESIIFKKDDVIDLKNKIIKNINNEHIAKKAYDFAKKYPSFEDISEKYYNLI